ncbi:class 1b ribonucleoside-diphosphate reductase subunit beta [Facklamia lactis]|uniref:class 1b ribonucleoside-diphosphate reductase subunit beta n=1 Tax=Facklamia lactis TaxID=2749967 RepID=UPI0018CE5442|nr:class 1b ribonucleoside-diphosphate reductase subunit beta [Facklamia lactis]MBG9981190.1 class 1b ribonucleoside-diphosphate reductase subunit beta [Facklamia lactis]
MAQHSHSGEVEYYKAIDWNRLEDALDKQTWEKLTSQFWLDTRVPVSNDLADWRSLTEIEQEVINHAFVGLTLLDTLQSEEGANVMREDIRSQHEEAVLNNILFMESVHAKSYSTIFISLNDSKKIDEIFAWGNQQPQLQYKAKVINEIYQSGTALQKKIASVFLESFLFYSGFYAPLWYLGNAKLENVAEIIKLIIRDESVHGTYLGYKFQLAFRELSQTEQKELENWMYLLLNDLMTNEEAFAHIVYDAIGWTKEVKVFMRYNANKALQNLGFPPLYADGIAERVNPIVMNGLSTNTSNHDFFSQVGSGYLMGEVEAMNEEDYDF